MKRLREVIDIFDRTNELLAALAGVLVIFIMLSVTYDVITRYFLGRGTRWVLEVTSFSLLFITFLGAAWLLKGEGHVRMDLLLNRLNPRRRSLLNAITSIICAITWFIAAWYGAKVAWSNYQTGYTMVTPLRTPQFLVVSIIPIGSSLLFIQFVRRGYGYLRGWRAPPKKKEGIERKL